MNFIEKSKNIADILYQNRHHVHLTIGMLEDGKIDTIHFNENKEITNEKYIYPVGSIGKPFTASVLAKHLVDHEISLDDHLDKYIPNLTPGYYPTIKRLLTHHSGYGGIPFSLPVTLWKLLRMNSPNGLLHINPFRGTLDEKVMFDILNQKKLKDQDYKFEYSNFGFGILGYIVSKLEGKNYFNVMEDYFKELGLKDTSMQNLHWTGYDKKENPCKPWQWENTDIIAPAGAMVSSVEDLLAFAKYNMDGTLPYVDILHQKYAEGEKTFDQGLAWRIKKDSNISFHVGSAGAFSAILAMDRTSHKAVVIALNYALVDGIEDLAFSML